MTTIKAFDFAVKIDELHKSTFIAKTYSEDLSANQILLEIDKISFTSNNITYGVIGERMNYWKFFPTQTEYGIIPAWGFATVIASQHPDVEVGERFYGYYPMGTHLLVTTNKCSNMGFVDTTVHRRALPPIYNFYSNIKHDLSITPDTEDLISIFRPLFVTSFLIDHSLAASDFNKSAQIFLTSASSKTAQALAFLLSKRKEVDNSKYKIIGLTSTKNLEFVQRLGWYDQAISYDETSLLDTNTESIIVDFRGNHDLQYKLQTVMGDKLIHNCLVGIVDWENLRGENILPRKGTFFFAPDHAKRLQEEWGLTTFQKKIETAWLQFTEAIQSSITIKEHKGKESLEALYLDMLNGNINPRIGDIVKFHA